MMSLVQLLLERGRFDSLKYFWLWLAVDFRFQNRGGTYGKVHSTMLM